jgi:DUF971 family protein
VGLTLKSDPARDWPVEIEVTPDATLRIRFSDGKVGACTLAALRQACPCAACREQRAERAQQTLPTAVPADEQDRMVRLLNMALVGRYAIRVEWADGHDTGIYEYGLLRELCESDPEPPVS